MLTKQQSKQNAITALHLISDANEILANGLRYSSVNDAKVLWRIIDAAGLLSESVRCGAIGTPGSPTGRGYYICHRQRKKKAEN